MSEWLKEKNMGKQRCWWHKIVERFTEIGFLYRENKSDKGVV